MDIEKKIEQDYLFGCIKFNDKLNFYLMPIAYWILNHKKYDPIYDPNEWESVFRDNILNVDKSNIEDFLNAIKVDLIELKKGDIEKYNLEDVFLFYIDFDSNLFVSYFDEIDLEDYVPNKRWKYKFANPSHCVPSDLIKQYL
ncbi:hypothetical protein H3Z83_02830 [Tenacibaculum sp. S7007]|uniref:Uncharacterized protein n=1 Tax=Tenacibaculum pelagium TaxID=2759527 RepID=A0A839AP07_9FLAO|nr:hypothetical protein [Tenacibaculum pelagium]MBA6155461.1 hypothetical protein [Tenacibaculum pelagium]